MKMWLQHGLMTRYSTIGVRPLQRSLTSSTARSIGRMSQKIKVCCYLWSNTWASSRTFQPWGKPAEPFWFALDPGESLIFVAPWLQTIIDKQVEGNQIIFVFFGGLQKRLQKVSVMFPSFPSILHPPSQPLHMPKAGSTKEKRGKSGAWWPSSPELPVGLIGRERLPCESFLR